MPSSLKRAKLTLLTATAAMLSFVGAFVCALKLNGGPITMVVLAFFMYMYSGYVGCRRRGMCMQMPLPQHITLFWLLASWWRITASHFLIVGNMSDFFC
jgi:hypothetical protein